MKLTFLGAAHEVTGSCTYLEACGKKILVDYGMEQGADLYENKPIPVPPSAIDYVLLTHAHVDHSGLLPLLCAGGFTGEIHATEPTCALCGIMLRDSAHIQESEAEWKNRKARRAGREEAVPLYTRNDAEHAIGLLRAHPYQQDFALCPGVRVSFADAGHLLGSASIELWLEERGQTRKLVFSGDIGNVNKPIIRNPSYLKEADYVVMESTYGDREHGPAPDYVGELARVLKQTFDRGGNVVIPAFAVGRTQEMLYFLRQVKAAGLVKGHEGFPVYVDSPLAIEATNVFGEHMAECLDAETAALVRSGVNPIAFDGLITAVTEDESRAINFDNRPKVILSASGMCEAGRIRHHLKHNLWREESTILFVGYQSQGTLGRILVEGAGQVKLFGEEITVRAHIEALAGSSGHADVNGLLRWAGSFDPKPQVFVLHGAAEVCETFAARLHGELGLEAAAPYSGAEFDLLEGVWLVRAKPVPIAKKPMAAKLSPAFLRLKAAVDRLARMVERGSGRPNKDLARLTDQLEKLCDKWDG